MTGGGRAATVRDLIDAFDERDVERLLSHLDRDVRVEGLKGSFRGHEEVRRWATPTPEGELYMRLEVDELHELGDYVAAGCRRQWRWREDGELAEEEPFGALFRFRGEKVVDWDQRYPALADAIDAIPA